MSTAPVAADPAAPRRQRVAARRTAAPPLRPRRRSATSTRPTYIAATPGAPRPAVRGRAARPGQGARRTRYPIAEPFLDIRSLVKASPDPGARQRAGAALDRVPARLRRDPDSSTSTSSTTTATIEIDEFSRSRPPTRRSPTGASRRPVIVIPHRARRPTTTAASSSSAPTGACSTSRPATAEPASGRTRRDLDVPARQGDPDRASPATAAKPYRVPALESVRRRPGPGRDLRLRAAQPVAVELRRVPGADRRRRAVDTGRRSTRCGSATSRGVELRLARVRGRTSSSSRPSPAPTRPPSRSTPTATPRPAGCAIVGGYVVRDPNLADLYGRYLYARLLHRRDAQLPASALPRPPGVALDDAPVAGISRPRSTPSASGSRTARSTTPGARRGLPARSARALWSPGVPDLSVRIAGKRSITLCAGERDDTRYRRAADSSARTWCARLADDGARRPLGRRQAARRVVSALRRRRQPGARPAPARGLPARRSPDVEPGLQPGRRHGRHGVHREQQGRLHALGADQHAHARGLARGRRRALLLLLLGVRLPPTTARTRPRSRRCARRTPTRRCPRTATAGRSCSPSACAATSARTSGSTTRVARYHNVYGPHGTFEGGREKAPAAICRKIAEAKLSGEHEIEVWGDGEQTRSFMYIDDCLEGTRRIMDSDDHRAAQSRLRPSW